MPPICEKRTCSTGKYNFSKNHITSVNVRRREGTMHTLLIYLAYAVPLFTTPILATIICFVVTQIWGD